MAAPPQTPLQKGGELVGRAIAADNAHKYEEALTLYEQAVEFLRQAIAQEASAPTRDSIATKVSEYERRINAIKQALGRPTTTASSLPAMPSAPTNAPVSPVAAPPVLKPSAPQPTASPYPQPPSAAAPAPTAPAQPPPMYPPPPQGWPVAPPGYGAPPPPYPPMYPPPPPGWPQQYPVPPYPYPYPYPPPQYPYPYPPPPVQPQPQPPQMPLMPQQPGGMDTSQLPLGSFIGNPMNNAAPAPATAVTVLASQPSVYSSPLVNTLSAHPQPMADHSMPQPMTAGKMVTAETMHSALTGSIIRLRAEIASDLVVPGSTIPVRVIVDNQSNTKIDHIRIKLKSLDDTYRPGQHERRVTLAARDYYNGLPMRGGNYDQQLMVQVPVHMMYFQNGRVQHYISVSAVTGMLAKNLHVRLAVRFR